MSGGRRHRIALIAAIAVGTTTALALGEVGRACAARAALRTATTRRLLVIDRRAPADRASYAAAIADAPVDAGLFNQWLVTQPAGATRSAGLALLRRMGFRDTDAQLNIMADSLQRGDRAQFALRLDALFARQAGRHPIVTVLSRMERTPAWQPSVVDRLRRGPAWRNQFLFNAAALADPVGRRARLGTLRLLDRDGDTRAVAAFAARESWMRGDISAAYAFWRVGGTIPSTSARDRFPFEWQVGSGADLEVTEAVHGNRLALGIRWNGHGDAPFATRRLPGPFVTGAALTDVAGAPDMVRQVEVTYRCQGGSWRNARRETSATTATFRVDAPLACPAGEVAIVPADGRVERGTDDAGIDFTLPLIRPNGGGGR